MWVLALSGSVGCGADTGIIVQVLGQPVEELAFQVALSRDHDQYVLDPSISGEKRSVQGRDLRADPYELLLKQEWPAADTPASTVRVLALGYRSGAIASFALMEPPQLFIKGELLSRSLVLQELSAGTGSASSSALGCFSVQTGGKSYQLVIDADRDCDGISPPQDCNDFDSSVHPGAPEICDGKDNNCDGTYAGPEDCYGLDSTGATCRVGSRTCTEGPTGGGTLGTCTVADEGVQATELQCQVYKGCATQTVPLQCLQSRTPTYGCKLEATESSGVCGGVRDLTPPFSGKGTCSWKLVDAGGWQASVQPPATGSCTGKLVLAAKATAGTGTITVVFTQGDQTAVLTYQITPSSVGSCTSHPFTCTKK
jgi:hypothetical protein